MTTRIPFILLLALVLSGCTDIILPQSNRIYEVRSASPATSHHSLVMSTSLDWFASENGDRYDIWLPPGTYRVEAEDTNYLYYQAPKMVAVGTKKLFSARDSRTCDGGVFISKGAGSKYPSGAYIDYAGGKKLLVFFFDWRFTRDEGKGWHYVDE